MNLKFLMRWPKLLTPLLALWFIGFFLVLGFGLKPLWAGNVFYGTITQMRGADSMTFSFTNKIDMKTAKTMPIQYHLTLAGVDIPQDKIFGPQTAKFVSNMVMGKYVRVVFQGRTPNGIMKARLFIFDKKNGAQEVAREVIRAGLARKQANADFKNNVLAKAEEEAQKAGRGLWARRVQ